MRFIVNEYLMFTDFRLGYAYAVRIFVVRSKIDECSSLNEW